jgi:hypothetical protein
MRTYWRRFKNHWHQENMLLAFALWLCVSPVAFIAIAWFFGWEAGVLAVGVLFFIALILCWGICLWPAIHSQGETHVDRPRLR